MIPVEQLCNKPVILYYNKIVKLITAMCMNTFPDAAVIACSKEIVSSGGREGNKGRGGP